MNHRTSSANPRLDQLRPRVERSVLGLLRSHGWSATITREIDHSDCIEVIAERCDLRTRIAVLYSTGISNSIYLELSGRVDHIFFLYGDSEIAASLRPRVTVPIDPLGDFLPFLVDLSKQLEPDRSPPVAPHRPLTVRRLTAENPLESVIARLEQFTSVKLSAKLVERRATTAGRSLSSQATMDKAMGVAYSMRSALDYFDSTSSDKLNKRVIGLYYGTIAFAQAEMLASPSGPINLDAVENMTKQGHGLYALSGPSGGFSGLRVGVLATGFLRQWMDFLGYDVSDYPTRRPRSWTGLNSVPANMVCSLQDLFASMPEIDDLFEEVFGALPRWVSVSHDSRSNYGIPTPSGRQRKTSSTYAKLVDRSGRLSVDSFKDTGWPLADIQRDDRNDEKGVAFRVRVDHAGHLSWWSVLQIHSSPFGKPQTLLLPTVGGHREYRTIAAVTLYALSIMARYMPSAWRRIEGGDDDQYLALVRAAMAVWERVLPEQFLETVAGETVRTAQPGSLFA